MRFLPGFTAAVSGTPDVITERASPKAEGIAELATDPPSRTETEPVGGATTGV